MSHVACDGDEASIGECSFYGLNVTTVPRSCDHSRDVGISCSSLDVNLPPRRKSRRPQTLMGHGQSRTQVNVPKLGSALDMLEAAIGSLESTRLVIEDAHTSRLSRLRLRLNRLAGKTVETCAAAPSVESTSTGESVGQPDESQATEARQRVQRDSELGISPEMASRLPADLLKELRNRPRKSKPLSESRKEFEENQAIERFDPLANDPVVQAIRNKPQNYVPEVLREQPLTQRKPHERLLKPPIQTMINRKPPRWEDAHRQLVEYTKKQIKLGLAPEGILRTLEPGPWDHDPAFWSTGSRDLEGTLEHEIDDEVS